MMETSMEMSIQKLQNKIIYAKQPINEKPASQKSLFSQRKQKTFAIAIQT